MNINKFITTLFKYSQAHLKLSKKKLICQKKYVEKNRKSIIQETTQLSRRSFRIWFF